MTRSLKHLKYLLSQGEGARVEFKESASKGLDKEIVAFANASGGRIYIGVTDSGRIKGVTITSSLKNAIQDIAKNCDPKIFVSFKALHKEKILIVDVPEGKNKPHKCSSGFYIRLGASSQKLSRDGVWQFMSEEELFKFDRQIHKNFDPKVHFDKEKLFSFMDRTGVEYSKRNYLQLLENLEVVQRKARKIAFKNTGVLFFSKNLKSLLPQAELSCAVFSGPDKSSTVVDRKRYNQDIIHNVESAMGFLTQRLQLEYRFPKGSLLRQEVLEIPENALREALVNAVTHRNYSPGSPPTTVEIFSNRVEICNFGPLPKELKKADFGKRSFPRNPLVAELMLRAKYIEKMGTGIQKMKKAVERAGLKPIGFDFTSFTSVTLYRPVRAIKKTAKKQSVDRDEKLSAELCVTRKKAKEFLTILNHIENGNFDKATFVKEHGMALRTLNRNLTALKNNKLVIFVGPKKTGSYKVAAKYKKIKKQ